MGEPRRDGISVVIPAYDAAPWLPSTIEALTRSLDASEWDAEIVVVDDGSTDGTAEVLEGLAAASTRPFTVVRQENRGRFHARRAGAEAARHDLLLLLDARVLVHDGSLAHLAERIGDGAPWNGHVGTDPGAPLVGHFWTVPTTLFWSSYLARPRPMEITRENFDRLPKGTGFLVIRRELFDRACRAAWPDGDGRLVSDDTRLLRAVVEETPIRLDPGFSATYRPRVSVRSFLRHAFERGTLFVDSYAGTSAARNAVLVALAIAPIAALAALVALLVAGAWLPAVVLAALALLALAAPAPIAASRGAGRRAVVAYLAYVAPFGVVFWAGLVRGLVVHRSAFRREPEAVA